MKMVSGIFSTTFALGMDKKSACSSLRSRSPNTGHKKLKAGAFSKSNHKYVTKHSVASYCHSYLKRLLLFLELYCWMICTVQKQPFNALVQILPGYLLLVVANCLSGKVSTWVTYVRNGGRDKRPLVVQFQFEFAQSQSALVIFKTKLRCEKLWRFIAFTFFTVATCLAGFKVSWEVVIGSSSSSFGFYSV